MIDRFEFVIDHLPTPGRLVLNLGCCGNPWDKWHSLHDEMVKVCGKKAVWGVDLWGEGVKRMKSEGHPVFWGNVERLDECLPEGAHFDVIVAGEVIEHLTNPAAFLESAKRVLAPGGKLIITTPNSWAMWSCILYGVLSREEIHPEHVTVYNEDCLKKMLTRHGWDVLKVEHLLQEKSAHRRFRHFKEIPERLCPRLRPIVGVVATSNLKEIPPCT